MRVWCFARVGLIVIDCNLMLFAVYLFEVDTAVVCGYCCNSVACFVCLPTNLIDSCMVV